jgi:hypothetical protein
MTAADGNFWIVTLYHEYSRVKDNDKGSPAEG